MNFDEFFLQHFYSTNLNGENTILPEMGKNIFQSVFEKIFNIYVFWYFMLVTIIIEKIILNIYIYIVSIQNLCGSNLLHTAADCHVAVTGG